MVKVCLVSDIHIEFGPGDKNWPEVDVTILAGDITVARCLAKEHWHQDKGIRKNTHRLLEKIREKSKRIIWYMGNHEAYGTSLPTAWKLLTEGDLKRWEIEFMDFQLGNCVTDLAPGVKLVAGTLWTDFNQGNSFAMASANRNMNDFRLIADWTPDEAYKAFQIGLNKIDEVVKTGDKVVVATHHAPSIHGINRERYGRFVDLNYAYYSDLDEWIEKRPNITHWLHGHTHIQKHYEIAHATVISNARGYVGHDTEANQWHPDKGIFEV